MEMQFAWDRVKAERNEKLHGISFETAQEVFSDPFHVIVENDFIDDEQRYLAVGRSGGQTLIALIFVDRSESDTILIRIISARKATAYEDTLSLAQG
jgi:uncharacterized DUF497 family protein